MSGIDLSVGAKFVDVPPVSSLFNTTTSHDNITPLLNAEPYVAVPTEGLQPQGPNNPNGNLPATQLLGMTAAGWAALTVAPEGA